VTEKNVVTAIHDTLHAEMVADDRVVVLGEDIATRGGVFVLVAVLVGYYSERLKRDIAERRRAEAAIVTVPPPATSLGASARIRASRCTRRG
jgi:pyruvate/2-oxoglutarate/acetoin dehydrogenase E1 component